MFDEFSRREVALICALILLATVLTVIGTVYLVNMYLLDRSYDPLSKAPPVRIEQTK